MHDHQSHVFVADLRTVAARRPNDPAVIELITTLTRRSAEFAALWDIHEVAVRRHERKRLVHPSIGVIDVTCLSLLSEDGSQRLLWFTPAPDGRAHDKFALLSVVGEQDLLPDGSTVNHIAASEPSNPGSATSTNFAPR